MSLRFERFETAFVGVDGAMTRRALLLAGVLVIAGAMLEYLTLLTGFESELLVELHRAFVLDGYGLTPNTYGLFAIVGLATIHAYLNEGYLLSVMLGTAPVYGNVLWTIGSPTRIEGYYLDPVSAFARTFPEGAMLATLGFLLGFGLRWIRSGRQGNHAGQPNSG